MLLNDLMVLDLSRHLPGPFAARMMADWGARVIKIEDPALGDPVRWTPPYLGDQSTLFLELNRNKESLTLNLKNPAARQVFLLLVKQADVLIESFRPGVVGRLGIDPASLQKQNPGLIYCSISGYGQDGPDRERAGHDLNYIARAGLLSLNTDSEGRPIIPPVQIADLASGAMLALSSILAALYAREKTGEGKHLDVSLTDGALALASIPFSLAMGGHSPAHGAKTELTGALPFYNVYRTADGKYLTVAAIEPKFWENFCSALDRPDWIPKQFSDGKEREQLFQEIRRILSAKTCAEWMQVFHGRDVCCEPVNSLEEAMAEPQLRHRRMIREVEIPSLGTVKQLGNPVKISGIEDVVPTPAPRKGEHTGPLLRQLGYSEEEIRQLGLTGAI